jgi:hypothetical protein
MDPDDFLLVHIIWDVVDTLLTGGRDSGFFFLFVVLIWISVVAAIVLLEPGTVVTAVLIGAGLFATIAASLISMLIDGRKHT